MVTVSVLCLLLSAFSPPVHSSLTTFRYIPGERNQSDAQAACRQTYTDLVTVYSDEDNTKLSNLMMINGFSFGWIGLYRSQLSEKWSNGDPVTFRRLTGDCGTWPFCAALKADGSWESVQCTQTKYFMCYEQDVSSQTPNYHLILESKTWYEAQRYCRRNYTDLISIRDQQQNEVVTIKGLNSSTPFWIGLLCDDWQWSDGGNSAYRNWWGGQPRQTTDNCVRMRGGEWSSVPCDNEHHTLCYGTNIHVSAVALNWEAALDYCQRGNRAGMFKIDSREEQEEVESELKSGNVYEPVWVGLRQSILFGFWMWVDGSAVFPYSNWDEEKQVKHQGSQHCGAVDPNKQFRWRAMNCLSKYRALCHI